MRQCVLQTVWVGRVAASKVLLVDKTTVRKDSIIGRFLLETLQTG